MKQRIASLVVLFCLLLSLAACGGAGTAAPMTEEEYQSRVEELSSDVAAAMLSMGSLSASDEASLQEGLEVFRSMAAPFREFAAISNPPQAWAEAHSKIAEGCTGFADSLEGLCDSADKLLNGEMDEEAYTTAVTDFTTDLSSAAALLSEGFGVLGG